MIVDAIVQAKAANWDKHEAALAASLAQTLPPRPALDVETRRQLTPFLRWCEAANVRHAPAKPITVAAYILDQAGIKPASLMEQIGAIEILHAHFGLPNPVATFPARFAIADVLRIEAPRSWRQEERLLFAVLPEEIRSTISRRENERDKALRTKQNEIAEERRRLKAEADQSAAEENKTMPKKPEGWFSDNEPSKKKGEGPYSDSTLNLRRDDSALGYHRPVDITRKVDSNSKVNAGFPGPLKSDE